jgi:CRISPR-associated protein Cas2
MRLWLISYDISDDASRRVVEKRLIACGDRVNFSVFECYLSATEFKKLQFELYIQINVKTDSLRCYPLCTWCENKLEWQGLGRRSGHQVDWIL